MHREESVAGIDSQQTLPSGNLVIAQFARKATPFIPCHASTMNTSFSLCVLPECLPPYWQAARLRGL